MDLCLGVSGLGIDVWVAVAEWMLFAMRFGLWLGCLGLWSCCVLI